MDDSQKTTPHATPIQPTEVPASPVSPPSVNPPPAVDTIPQSVLRKHAFPVSFKSLSVLVLVLLLGSVFAVSQLSSKKDSMDVRSRASKKEDKNMLQNGYFERNLLNWKQSKKSNDVTIAIATDKKSQGTKSVKIVNTGGSDAYVYQDVKVEAGTWYTLRADAFKSAGNGEVKVEVTEYDMVGGNPKFNPKALSSRVYTGTDFQTRPMIFKTGKAEIAFAPQRMALSSKVYAVNDDNNCGKSTMGQCGPAGGCLLNQECKKADDKQEKYYCTDTSVKCNPSGGKKCGDSGTVGQCGVKGGCDSNIKCISNPYGGGVGCYGKCTGGGGGGDTPKDTTTPPPGDGRGGCQSDDECKAKPDQYCDASGACKDRPPNCGSICFNKDTDDPNITGDEMTKRCGGSDIDMVCAANSPDGNRYCWSDAGCSGGGGGQGGGGKADKYVRVLLHMNKAGTAYFDNVRFEKGRVNTAVKITSTAPTEATVGEELEYQLVASDAERDFLTYGLGNAPCPIGKPKCKKDAPPTPSGAGITQTGLFTFTPTASGAASIRLWATDGLLPGIQNLQLTVSP